MIVANGALQPADAQKCVEKAQLDWKTVNTCWTGTEGHALGALLDKLLWWLMAVHEFGSRKPN